MSIVSHKSTLKAGFTMIEIMLVVLIIGILGGMFILSQRGGQADAAKKAVISQFKQIRVALDTYEAAMGDYPEHLSDLWTPPTDSEKASEWREGGYIEQFKKYPTGWSPYKYEKTEGEDHPYTLTAETKDKKGRVSVWTIQ